MTRTSVRRPGFLRCDLHMHSRSSYDCLLTPDQIIQAALRRQLDAIAVTDHDTIRGGKETRKIAPPELIVIIGTEVHTDIGDIVCLFVEREIRRRDALGVIEEAHGQGGIAFLPHPLQAHPKPIPEQVLRACDGYEALNSRAGDFHPVAPIGSRSRWDLLADKAALGNSDAHFAWEIGRAYTVMPGPRTAENVRRQILERHTEAAGRRGPAFAFYGSQLIRLAKTRDPKMLLGLSRRLLRKLRGR